MTGRGVGKQIVFFDLPLLKDKQTQKRKRKRARLIPALASVFAEKSVAEELG